MANPRTTTAVGTPAQLIAPYEGMPVKASVDQVNLVQTRRLPDVPMTGGGKPQPPKGDASQRRV